jgi:hypothetical protein
MNKRERATGWWQRILHPGETPQATASGQAGASADWCYSWLLPGDAALAAPPAVRPESK